jgi:hypothetical protein
MPKRQAVGWNVGGYQTAGADHGVCADGDARHDDRSRAEPDTIADDDWPGVSAIRRLSRPTVLT